ncbi:MAG TPA: HAMP domain-containing sensor histidine kinase [Bacillota bacterium]|nr:HAMP domain-containing sensor histidine kinase [Bacillota bacterium]HOR85952.1 HAMP domain-containing sensor histidine kinase [Bacillota bacterium]HPL54560.1 HAMP domain-containing sensor histidine kinase [Bacillota bacterium]
MNLLMNRDVKKFLVGLLLTLLAGAVVLQIAAYVNAVRFKNNMVTHDSELAGYLEQKHPELSAEIQSAFTAVKSSADREKGKALLRQAGYRYSTEVFLVPRANGLYRLNAVGCFIFASILGAIVLIISTSFLKSHFRIIDEYSEDIARIMEGDVSIRLPDNGEGSLPKLAASINTMTSSLYAHIEKEKQHRVFMKDILENVSHQLKTPLSALFMYNEIMRDEDEQNEVILKFLGKSVSELERMQSLIANLLKLARLDAGIIELDRKDHSIKSIVEQVAESFEIRLKNEQKTCEVKAEGDIFYSCDREWMLEALSNLVKNAVEHTGPGSYIRIIAEETPVIVNISIEDNGEGIHPEDINHVFKRFYRSKFTQDKQGTGIGLTLTKTVIEMHGGFISVESTMGKGTKFVVHLPNLQNCKIQ